jgi:hypothetical protein
MPVPFAAISAGIGLVTSGVGFFQAQKQERDAARALNAFRRQELVNPARDIQISTLKADQQTDANLSSMATSVDAIQRTGARGVIGAVPRLSENNIMVQNQISQDIADQEIRREFAIADGEERIRGIREARETNAILGLGQQAQVGRENAANSLNSFASSLLAFSDTSRKNEAFGLNNTSNVDPITGTLRINNLASGFVNQNFRESKNPLVDFRRNNNIGQ